jgi:hypothetical protein
VLYPITDPKFLKNLPDPPVRSANWAKYTSKVEWLSRAMPKLDGREWYWIDDDVRTYAKEIEESNLPKERCIQVSEKGAGALEELRICLQLQREGLERLCYDQVKASASTLP